MGKTPFLLESIVQASSIIPFGFSSGRFLFDSTNFILSSGIIQLFS